MKKAILTAFTAVMVLVSPLSVKAKNISDCYLHHRCGNEWEIDVYDGMPQELDLPDAYHVEIVHGVVLDDKGNGASDDSTDGGYTAPCNYISYKNLPVHKGDEVITVLYYNVDDEGQWEDDIFYRIDHIMDK
jgi:hypothetical protein